MVLARVHVDTVDPAGTFEGILERIVTRRGDHEHAIVALQVEHLEIDPEVFPGKGVDVEAELSVAYEGGVVG